jgi:tetratricopeptide (TPR) repeat protein
MFTAGSGKMVYVPDKAVKHREMGEFLLNKRRHTTDRLKKIELLNQAIGEFKKALEIKPDFAVALNMLGNCYILQGQWGLALEYLNKALKIRQDYPAALFNRGRVYQELSVSQKGHEYLDKAIADYKQAVKSELAANFVGDIHKAMSEAYRKKGDYKKAIAQLNEYLKKAPHAPDAILVQRKIRGLTLMDKGDAPPLSPSPLSNPSE